MMKIESLIRLSAALPTKPNRPNEPAWINKSEQKQLGKERNSANDLPEGLFDKDIGTIVNTLKTKSKDFKQAISRLSYFTNRSGKNIDNDNKHKYNQVKEALYRAYGRELPAKDQM